DRPPQKLFCGRYDLHKSPKTRRRRRRHRRRRPRCQWYPSPRPRLSNLFPGWVVSHGYVTFLDFGVTVSVCGLTIQPGDLLFGDESGLLTVPLDIADALIQRAAEMREGERQFFEFLESRDLSFQE